MYAEVLLPVKLAWLPTYRSSTDLHRGQRVNVKLSGRDYVGVVTRTGVTPNCDPSKLQDIEGPAEGFPDISERELDFWQFISDYYLCSLGEVYKAAYPGGTVKSEAVSARRRRKRAGAEPEGAVSVNSTQTLFPTLEVGKPLLLVAGGRRTTYANAIRECLEEGRQVLLLSPDHILSDRLADFLEETFGDTLKTYNTRMTPARRQGVTDAVRKPGPILVMGTRCAVFLPFSDLGLVVIDEEQDRTYKQDSPAPRYNARDCAIMLAKIHGAKVLLGTSCPSLESELNAASGKYAILRDTGTAQGTATAEIIDVTAEKRKRGMNGNFSRKLLEAIGEVSGPIALIRGWEKPDALEEEIGRLLPGRDVTVLSETEARRKDLGAFDLVGVLQIDALSVSRSDVAKASRKTADFTALRADFRADEHLIRLVSELSSRSRRLVIQTASPGRLTRSVKDLLEERRRFGFPPYTRIVDFRDRSGNIVRRTFLKRGPSLSAEKARLLSELPPGCTVDVDPE